MDSRGYEQALIWNSRFKVMKEERSHLQSKYLFFDEYCTNLRESNLQGVELGGITKKTL